MIRALREQGRDLAGDCEHLPPLVEGEVGRDQRAAALARLDDHGRVAQPRDDPVPRRETPRRRLDPRRILGDDQAALDDRRGEQPVRARVVAVDTAAEDGHGRARLECASMRSPVDAASEARHDDHPGPRETARELRRDCRAVGGARAGADDRDARCVEQRRAPLRHG